MFHRSSHPWLLAVLSMSWALPGAGLLLYPPSSARAQSDCVIQLQEAQGSYDSGKLGSAHTAIQACLGGEPSRPERVQAYALLAKVHLAQDDREAMEEAIRQLLRINSGYEPALFDPPLFVRRVGELKQSTQVAQITSVSKTAESAWEAPATVSVISAEEIERRGYLDLEALLHDLPGFDIARANGVTYSNLYQRGYRSSTTDRTLFLVDGVEQNALWSNIAYLSRQYPLSHIARVEVIYGPASTMYGANAFTGVINVITKRPGEWLKNGKKYAVSAQLSAGRYDTRVLDATVAGSTRSGNLRFSLTGRIFRSDEQNLSGFPDWDYDPAAYFAEQATIQSYQERLSFTVDPAAFDAFMAENSSLQSSGLFDVDPRTRQVTLTEAGLRRARELDQAAFTNLLNDAPIGFTDRTDDWYISGRLNSANLEVGFNAWSRQEGSTGWYTDRLRPGADNGGLWGPRQNVLYLKYSRALTPELSWTFFSRFKDHELDRDSAVFTLDTYANGRLGFNDLLEDREASYNQTFLFWGSTQMRNELGLVWEPSARFNLVGGLELRNSSLQGDYVRSKQAPARQALDENGLPGGGNHFSHRDLGVYAQLSYRALDNLKLVAGGRIDNNDIRETRGYGTVFNPRFAVIYTPGSYIFKAIYSEAFKDASNFNKYATLTGVRERPNPDLEPENVENFELGLGRQINDHLVVDLTAYDATYTNALTLVQVPSCAPQEPGCGTTTGQFQALSSLRNKGLQGNVFLSYENFSLFGNYTYTDAVETTAQAHVRVGDIASHQLNLGVNFPVWQRLNLNLRFNWVDARPTGEGTTVTSQRITKIDSHLVANAAVTYKELLPGVGLQLIVQNLFDEEYVHPGVREAGGGSFASVLPQPGRSVYLRLITRY